MRQKKHPYKKLGKYFKPVIWLIMLSLGFSFVLNLGHLANIATIIPFVHKIITGTQIVFAETARVPAFIAGVIAKINSMPAITMIYGLVIWFCLFGLIRSIASFFCPLFLNMASEKLMRNLRNDIYKKLLGLSLDFYSKSSTGKLISKITYDVTVLKNSISQGIMDLIKEPMTIVFNLGAAIICKTFFPISFKLIAITLAFFLIVIYPVMAIGRKLRKIARQGIDKMADINRILYETISGIRIVKAFSNEKHETDKFNKENTQFYKITIRSIKRMLILSPMTEYVGLLGIVTVLWFVRHNLVGGNFAFGAFTVLMLSLAQLMKPIKKLSRLYGIHQQAMAAATRIFELMDAEASVKEKEDAQTLAPFRERIAFKNVSFKYDKTTVLKNVNLNVKKGQIAAIVGPSGVGKTTLVNLIPRFYDATEGSLRIDGTDVKDVTFSSLLGQIGLVTQDTILFNDTVTANIAYGKSGEVIEESIISAAKIANAHNFITKLPEGYDTVIGEKGFRLSGGEKQRLAIARAVYKNPPILILDEATSQLDTESEKLVQEALDRLMKGRTVFIIAHRLSTVKNADKIIVLEKGKVTEKGSHEELVEKKGLYKRLYDMQFSNV